MELIIFTLLALIIVMGVRWLFEKVPVPELTTEQIKEINEEDRKTRDIVEILNSKDPDAIIWEDTLARRLGKSRREIRRILKS